MSSFAANCTDLRCVWAALLGGGWDVARGRLVDGSWGDDDEEAAAAVAATPAAPAALGREESRLRS